MEIKDYDPSHYIGMYMKNEGGLPKWQLCMWPHPYKTESKNLTLVPIKVPTIYAENIVNKDTYGYASGLKSEGHQRVSFPVSEIEKVEMFEKKSLLSRMNAIRVWLRGNKNIIALVYSKKLYGQQVDEIFQYLQQAAEENAIRIVREKEELEKRQKKMEQEEKQKKMERERMLNSMTPAQRQAFLDKERAEAEETARRIEAQRYKREQFRAALQAQRKEDEKDRQIKELTEQLKIANQRAASAGGSSGAKDVVKGAAAGWIVAGPVGGVIGAIAGKAKSDGKK